MAESKNERNENVIESDYAEDEENGGKKRTNEKKNEWEKERMKKCFLRFIISLHVI